MAISISRFISIPAVTILTTLLGLFTSSSLATEISSFQLNKPVQIELGSGAVLDPDLLEIRVVGINDLRCPKSTSSGWVVRCYWGGEAQVKLNLSQAGKNLGDLDLTLGTINPEYFYRNNIKQVGKYYIRLLEVAPHRVAFPPNERNKVEPNNVKQTVTLQVQKTPFKLRDANLDPRQQPRPLNATSLGKRFPLLNTQSHYLSTRYRDRNGNHYVQAQIYFDYAHPIPGRSDFVEISVGIQPTGSPTRLNTIKRIVKLGTPIQIENREGGFNFRLLKVESFTEDTRSNLNYPSPIGYRAWLQVEQLKHTNRILVLNLDCQNR